MYILEFLLKTITKPHKPASLDEEEPVYERCEHVFLPVDSSERRFACSKCGQYAELEEKSEVNKGI